MATSNTPVLVDPQKEQNYLDLAGSLQNPSQPAKDSTALIPVIVAGMSLLGQVGSFFLNRWQQKEQNEWQEGLISKQNEYNSPSAQLNRLLSAGVPYNTAMSMMGGTVGAATQPMSGQAAPYTSVQPPSMGDVAGMVASSDQHDIAQSQVRLNDAQAYSLDPDNPLNLSYRNLNEAQRVLLNTQNDHELKRMGLTDQEISNLQQSMKILKYQTKEAFWRAVKTAKEAKSYDKFLDAQVKSLASRSGLDEATAMSILKKLVTEIKLMEAQASYQSAQAAKTSTENTILGATDSQGKLLSVLLKEFEVNNVKLDNKRKVFDLLPLLNGDKWSNSQYSDWLSCAYLMALGSGQFKDPVSIGRLQSTVTNSQLRSLFE